MEGDSDYPFPLKHRLFSIHNLNFGLVEPEPAQCGLGYRGGYLCHRGAWLPVNGLVGIDRHVDRGKGQVDVVGSGNAMLLVDDIEHILAQARKSVAFLAGVVLRVERVLAVGEAVACKKLVFLALFHHEQVFGRCDAVLILDGLCRDVELHAVDQAQALGGVAVIGIDDFLDREIHFYLISCRPHHHGIAFIHHLLDVVVGRELDVVVDDDLGGASHVALRQVVDRVGTFPDGYALAVENLQLAGVIVHHSARAKGVGNVKAREMLLERVGIAECLGVALVKVVDALGVGCGHGHAHLAPQTLRRATVGVAWDGALGRIAGRGQQVAGIVVARRVKVAVDLVGQLLVERIDAQAHGHQRVAGKGFIAVCGHAHGVAAGVNAHEACGVNHVGWHELGHHIAGEVTVVLGVNRPEQLGTRARVQSRVLHRFSRHDERGVLDNRRLGVSNRRANVVVAARDNAKCQQHGEYQVDGLFHVQGVCIDRGEYGAFKGTCRTRCGPQRCPYRSHRAGMAISSPPRA